MMCWNNIWYVIELNFTCLVLLFNRLTRKILITWVTCIFYLHLILLDSPDLEGNRLHWTLRTVFVFLIVPGGIFWNINGKTVWWQRFLMKKRNTVHKISLSKGKETRMQMHSLVSKMFVHDRRFLLQISDE